MQHMPNLTIASFRMETLWRISQLGSRTSVLVYMRVRFLKYTMLKATITSQSTSQVISCYTALKQRLALRFPNQGTAEDEGTAEGPSQAAADVNFALRVAKDAARRMPQGGLRAASLCFHAATCTAGCSFAPRSSAARLPL
jgi:hypothetical protein